MSMLDQHQLRYITHQNRKKMMLETGTCLVDFNEHPVEVKLHFRHIFKARVSQRIFNGKPVEDRDMRFVEEAIVNTPSSCNRQAIKILRFSEQSDKDDLASLLVGGKNWINKADRILLLMADMDAYKSPAEVNFMPYLDAGFIGMSVYYAAESVNVGCCFVNPNIREEQLRSFHGIFNELNNNWLRKYRFCGAIALGKYDKKSDHIEKTADIFIN